MKLAAHFQVENIFVRDEARSPADESVLLSGECPVLRS